MFFHYFLDINGILNQVSIFYAEGPNMSQAPSKAFCPDNVLFFQLRMNHSALEFKYCKKLEQLIYFETHIEQNSHL